ncbi:hypothetical protein ACM46_08150 [Chryseobacterium angstadtii]|uniref:Uncharacterized protein n=1 Tax=Chryseobacterium angstadtii TaxID=558151 RepID=A0A0J7II96_9FLAO|nr:hypothetical protein [Chryseobacterium angstadtii]KMQ65812.1 hypothetical protein ACM46_08150 [Chryseobacterium angstadtii]
MKRKIVFFLFISGLSFSQQQLVKITDLQPKTEDSVFPLISYSKNPLVEKKINTYLQVSELEYIPDSGGNPFKLVSTATNSYSNYVYFYSWKKLQTPDNILSIAMDGEASGAYPEGFSNWENFDLRTGNAINAYDLFQPSAVKAVENIINKKVRKRINDFLTQLKSEKNPTEEVQEQIGLYEGCSTDNTLEYIKFYFGKTSLTFVAGRCSNHAMRALDDLDSHSIEVPYKDLEKYWSSYAKNLLSGSGNTATTGFQNKLMKGKIDQYPITVLIKHLYQDNGETSFSAVYWYDKNKKLIEWSGKIKGDKISITENDRYDEGKGEWIQRAEIQAVRKGSRITGTWQDYKTKKYLNLELEEL